MGISCTSTDGIIVTGGSLKGPYVMSDLAVHATVSQYISTGGYGDNKFTVSKNLTIGSTLGDTYFDLFGSIIEMSSGYTLTLYSTAARGGGMGQTFGASVSDSGAKPFIDEDVRKTRIEGVRQLFVERQFSLDNVTGEWNRLTPTTIRIVAVAANADVTDVVPAL